MKEKLVRLLKQLIGFIPTRLPNGVAAFHVWAEDMAATYDLPTPDLESIKFTLSTVIMHLGPQTSHKPKYYFVVTLRASAAKQVAGQVFTDIKMKQKQAELDAAQKPLENASQ